MENIADFISGHQLLVASSILIFAYIFIATEKISKVTVALLGASLTILLRLVEPLKGSARPHYFANFIEFNVIFLLVSMMIIVNIAAKSGIFTWLANELLKKTKGSPALVFWALGIFTAVASAFLDNVTTVILVMPVTFLAAKKLGVSPVPFLIMEIIASNIGGTATLIGDPPNIIIGNKAGFSFLLFLKELTAIVTAIFIVCMGMLHFMFRKKLVSNEEKMRSVAELDNSQTIKDKILAKRSVIVMALVILGFIIHDATHIEAYLIAMTGASFMLIFENPHTILKKVEWNTIFFFIGLFIIIGGFEAAGGISVMARWILDVTHGSEAWTSMLILWASGGISGIVDNIPYTATMAPMIYEIQTVQGAAYAYPLWWCLALGACLGGNMTIIGAAANVIVSETAAGEGYKISFMKFLKYGLVVTFISLLMSSVYIYFKFLT
jgi:Na+/H+ antiporter NhaD/arsenite permease-like protein